MAVKRSLAPAGSADHPGKAASGREASDYKPERQDHASQTRWEDSQVEAALTALQTSVEDLIKVEPAEAKTRISAELLQKFNTCHAYLNSTHQQLKAKKRPPEELAACQYHLARLLHYCPTIFTQSAKGRNNLMRILSGITHCANVISLAKEVKNKEIKNNLIVNSMIILTALLGQTEALTAINALPEAAGPDGKKPATVKQDFLRKLHAHLREGLASLEVTAEFSEEAIATYRAATQPLVNLIWRLLHPRAEPVHFFKKPLAGFGVGLGASLAHANDESAYATVALMGIGKVCGSKIGQTADDILTEVVQPASVSRDHFTMFKKPLALVGGAVGLYLGLSSGALLASMALSMANTTFLTALWGTLGYKTGEWIDNQVDQCQKARKMKLS